MGGKKKTFGSDSRYTVFILDMTTRHLDIHASKSLSRILTSAALSSIADNVYRYASREEYSECAVETFRLIVSVLKDEERTSGEFIFRGNIRWGMGEEEVLSMEGEHGSRNSVGDFRMIAYENVPVSHYRGELGYVFTDDRLVLCLYGIYRPDPKAEEYLTTALDSVYGAEDKAFSAEIASVMSGIMYDGFDIREGSVHKWPASGDTMVYLFLSVPQDYLYIAYISPEMADSAAGTTEDGVDTTGL